MSKKVSDEKDSEYKEMKRKRIIVNVAWGVLLFFIAILFCPFSITYGDGDSMLPTLVGGTYEIINRADKSYDNGDIIATTLIPLRPYEPGGLGKRIIAGPGDVVYISSVEDKVYVNGEISPYSFSGNGPQYENEILPYVDKEVVLDEGMYFIMGDNRPVSYDSRFFGPISDYIIDGTIVYAIKGIGYKPEGLIKEIEF